ncbi:MAG: TRAP transporter large permease, partial [Myxococcales bacterium]|nr:TRAP transporter large permease [Myxococcales bacterium]
MMILLAIAGLALIGAPLFVIIGAATGVAFEQYTVQASSFWRLGEWVLNPFENLMGKDAFLAVPLFIGAGAIMTEGGMARRLVDFMRALLGWLPGGLGMAAVAACMGFAAISGSSPVTLIAVGSIMFPALVKAGYPEKFSLGLVMTAGSLGCLMVPSLILVIYALAVMSAGSATVDTGQMFVAAYVPATAVALILCLYSYWVGRGVADRARFSWARLWETAREGVWALALPLIVFFGIREGFFAPFKAGAVAFAYALVVTTVIHREIDLRKLINVLADAGRLMGMLILIIALTFSLNQLFALMEVEKKLAKLLLDWNLGPIGFMLLTNVFLIVLGALMDSVSATLVFAPILAPIAVTHYGIDPVHFGIVFVVNMEIGYLAPPVATNLFVAAALFKKPFGLVTRAIMPGLGLTTAALVLFMFVPTCSKGMINFQASGDIRDVWEPFPWDGKRWTTLFGSHDKTAGISDISEEATQNALDDTKIDKLSDDDYYFDDDDDATPVETDGDAGASRDA